MTAYSKKIYNILNDRYYRRINQFSKYIQNGDYVWNFTLSYLSLKNNKTSYLENITDIKLSKSRIVKKIIKNLLNLIKPYQNNDFVENNKFHIKGQVIMFSCSFQDIKIFDYDNKLMISEYQNESKYCNIINAHNELIEYFPLTKFLESDDGKRVILEEVITECFEFDAMDCLEFFSIKYLDFYRNQKVSKLLISDIYMINENVIVDKYFDSLDNNYIIVCKQHGDFWKSNILYGKHYYLIDLEKYGIYYFFYDYFLFIINEYIINLDDSLINKYFIGELNFLFEPVLDLFDLSFENKKKYFSEFIVFAWHSKWKIENNCPEEKLTIIFNKYYN